MGLFFVLLGLFIIGVGAFIAYRHAQIWDEERRIRRESVFDVWTGEPTRSRSTRLDRQDSHNTRQLRRRCLSSAS